MRGRSGGVKTWVIQRLSAVYIAVFMVTFLFQLTTQPPIDFQSWHTMMSSPLVNIAFICFWLAVISHAWIGMRDVVMDYVHDDGLRFIILSLLALFLIFMLVWLVKILITVGF